jgi:riboflavin biosynthesis pyrimidine reductase
VRLRGSVPGAAEVLVVDRDGEVDLAAAVAELGARGHGIILSEGGPTIFGSLLDAALADELFLTISPRLAGRSGGDERLGLVEGVSLLPDRGVQGRLLSARRDGDHLFLRYALGTPSQSRAR